MIKTRYNETRKRYHHEVSSAEDSDNSDGNDTPPHKRPRANSFHSCVQPSTTLAHRGDDKVSVPDEQEMNRNLKALQRESDDDNSGKDGIDDGEDDFKELAQKLNKEEELGESVQQTLDARPENCSSLVVKK